MVSVKEEVIQIEIVIVLVVIIISCIENILDFWLAESSSRDQKYFNHVKVALKNSVWI